MNSIQATDFINSTVFTYAAHKSRRSGEIFQLMDPKNNPKQMEEIAKNMLPNLRIASSTSKTRYQFYGRESSYRKKCLKIIFEESFKVRPNDIIAAAEKIDSQPIYPLWKRVSYIQIPKITGLIFQNQAVKIAICVSVYLLFATLSYSAYEKMTGVIASRAVPFIINNVSIKIIRLGNSIADAVDWLRTHHLRIFLSAWMLQYGLQRVPIPRLQELANRIDLWAIFTFHIQSVGNFIADEGWKRAEDVWISCNNLHFYFDRIAQKNDNKRLEIYKAKIGVIWEKLIDEKLKMQESAVV